MIPIAPFSIVNLVAGSTQISFRQFLLGTALGMTPGILFLSAILNGLEETLRGPTLFSFVGLGLFVGLTWIVIRSVLRHVPVLRPIAPAGTDGMTNPAS